MNALQSYILIKTKDIRQNETKLLINFLKPYKPVRVKTISRCVIESLKTAGLSVDYQGHS